MAIRPHKTLLQNIQDIRNAARSKPLRDDLEEETTIFESEVRADCDQNDEDDYVYK